MNKPLEISNEIVIDAAPSIIWNVLTNPEETKKYMFGCETVSNWKEGSPLLWKGNFDGKEVVAVKGTIVKMIRSNYLIYTTFDPNSSIPDIPENYLTVIYELWQMENMTHLKVTQGDYSKVADGDKRYAEAVAGGGWQSILEQVKKISEENMEPYRTKR